MKNKMELNLIFSVLSLVSSGFLQPVAPASFTREHLEYHPRTKRCSCANFLDKECVYFCHLDIIWVNTPERTVSYGLGSAPRQKRSVAEASQKQKEDSARCKCARRKDSTCAAFCGIQNRARTVQWVPSTVDLPVVRQQTKGRQHSNPKDPPRPGIWAQKRHR